MDKVTVASFDSGCPFNVAVTVTVVLPPFSFIVCGLTDSTMDVLAVSSSAMVMFTCCEPPDAVGLHP